MRHLKIFFLTILFISLINLNCKDETTSSNGSGTTTQQIVTVWANYNIISTAQNRAVHADSANVYISGVVRADPIPTFEYYKAGGQMFSGDSLFWYNQGYISFGDWNLRITENLDPLTVEVKTSQGTVSGTITVPDTIDTAFVNHPDTLPIGQSLIVSWSGSGADFYNLYLYYEWIDNQGYWHYEYENEVVKNSPYTFPANTFPYNGIISYIGIRAMNGPFPQPGANGNMTGNGTGFLYYDNDRFYTFNSIVVGTGSSTLPKRMDREPDKQKIKLRMQKKIESMIYENNSEK